MAITIRYNTFTKSGMMDMTLRTLKDNFKGPALALSIGAATLAGFSSAANAECAPLKKTAWGQDFNASPSAHAYSQENIGSVGISIYPGSDLAKNNFTAEQLGDAIVSAFAKAGVNAECFVNNSLFDKSGTALGFKIDGLSIKIDGDNRFDMGQVWNDKRILVAAVNEAKTARLLLTNNELALR